MRESVDTKVRTILRPLRHAYFFSSAESFRRAVAISCTQWGGMYSLMVPMNADGSIQPIFASFLRGASPDRIVHYDGESQTNLDLFKDEIRRALGNPRRYSSAPILQGNDYFEKHEESAHALHAVKEEKPDLTVHDADGWGDPLLHDVLFGSIYSDQDKTYRQKCNVAETRITASDPLFWQEQAKHGPSASVLNFTKRGIQVHQAQGFGSVQTFQVVVGSTFTEYALFWNLRRVTELNAFQIDCRRVLMLPIELVSQESLGRIAHMIRSAPVRPNMSSNLDVAFIATGKDISIINDAVTTSHSFVKLADGKVSTNIWFGEDRRPRELDPGRALTYVITNKLDADSSATYGLGRRPRQQRVSLSYGRNEVTCTVPDDYRPSTGDVVVELESDAWQRYPKSTAVAQRIVPTGSFAGNKLVVQVAPHSNPLEVQVELLDEWEAFRQFIDAQGYLVRRSRNGVYGDAMIQLVGGVEGLSVLSDSAAYALMSRLAVVSSKKVAQRLVRELTLDPGAEPDVIRALGGLEVASEYRRVGKTFQALKSEMSIPAQQLNELLERLVAHRVIRRGQYIECPTCQAGTWWTLAELREEIACPGCASNFTLPVGRGDSDLRIEYRLNTLVDRVVDQDVIPHLIAIHHLHKKASSYVRMPGVEFLPKGEADVKGELDLVLVHNHQLVAGECKAGAVLTEKDVRSAELAAHLGFEVFYFVSMQTFDEASRDMVNAARKCGPISDAGMSVSMLEAKDLFSENRV